MLTSEQVTEGQVLLVTAPWPDGVTVVVNVRRSLASGAAESFQVDISAPGQRPDTYSFMKPIDRHVIAKLLAHADSIAEAGKTAGSGWFRDAVKSAQSELGKAVAEALSSEPKPRWLRAALARVQAAVPSDAGARRLAREVLIAAECDDAPVPQVSVIDGAAVVLSWRHCGREFEIACWSRTHAIAGAWSPSEKLLEPLWFRTPAERAVAYAAIRQEVRVALDLPSYGKEDMDALCYVGPK